MLYWLLHLYSASYQIIGVEERNRYYIHSNGGGGQKVFRLDEGGSKTCGLRRWGQKFDAVNFQLPCPPPSISEHSLKGALDKYDIYLFISNSIEDFKLDLFSCFYRCSVWVILWTTSSSQCPIGYATVLCIYWSRLWKIENARNIHISSKVSQSRR